MGDKFFEMPAGGMTERTLTALLEASAAISASLDLPEVLQTIAEAAARVLDAEASSVLTLDARHNRLVFQAACGDSGSQLVGQEMGADLGIAGRVVQTAKPLLVPDVSDHPDFFKGFDDKSDFVTRGIVAAPMLFRGKVVGVIEVLNKRGSGFFEERDTELMQIFANLAAIGVINAQRHEVVKRENQGLREASKPKDPVIGGSPAWREAMKMCERVAGTNSSVLLLGETGSGKEVLAQHVHGRSPRADHPFVPINCAALPETLLESELFGHEAGAFTGATARKLGRFELADGGTLFLDEIGDISGSTQIKLLRVLQEREFSRVGGTKSIACDVRIIAATNRDLKAAMEKNEFREDLYYRLNVFPINLPPLRQRVEDVPLLVGHFARRSAIELGVGEIAVSDEAMQHLCAYRWPGNVRELRNVIERAALLADEGRITPEQLPREIVGDEPQGQVVSSGSAVEGYEKALILKALQENDWNQTQTAAALGLSRDNLRYRLKKYSISRPGK